MSDSTPAVPTPVVDYPHLRLLAEWSSSLRGREVGFAFAHGALWREGHGAPAGAPALHVPAATPGRYGAVRSLRLSVPGAAEPLDLSPWGADALVWSDAAVEKFLVPYYASCAGARAARFLQTSSIVDRRVYVPFTAIKDGGRSVQGKVENSPFYTIERQASYDLVIYEDNRTSEPQEKVETLTVGVSETETEEYSVTSGMEVSYTAGVSFVAESSVSMSISTELGFSTSTSVEEF